MFSREVQLKLKGVYQRRVGDPEKFFIHAVDTWDLLSPPHGHVDDDEQQQRQRRDSASYDQRHGRQLQLIHVLEDRRKQVHDEHQQ